MGGGILWGCMDDFCSILASVGGEAVAVVEVARWARRYSSRQ
jgi:hypothetical protein